MRYATLIAVALVVLIVFVRTIWEIFIKKPPRSPTIYLAGPMTGIPDYNHPQFNDVARRLRSLGETVFNPAEIDGGSQSLPYERYMRIAAKQILECRMVVLLPWWGESEGAKFEVLMARKFGRPVYAIASLDPLTIVLASAEIRTTVEYAAVVMGIKP